MKWVHVIPSEPVAIYSEIDSGRWGRRKAEVYANGSMGGDDENRSIDFLPALQEIAADSQFGPDEISKNDLETV